MKIDLDISKILLGLVFVGLIFLLLNSYCGSNFLEGMEEASTKCNKNILGSRCPGINGVLCKNIEEKDCNKLGTCTCPTRAEICKKNCPSGPSIDPSIDPSAPSIRNSPPENYDIDLITNNEYSVVNFQTFMGILNSLKLPLTMSQLYALPDPHINTNAFIARIDPPIQIITETKDENGYQLHKYTFLFDRILTTGNIHYAINKNYKKFKEDEPTKWWEVISVENHYDIINDYSSDYPADAPYIMWTNNPKWSEYIMEFYWKPKPTEWGGSDDLFFFKFRANNTFSYLSNRRKKVSVKVVWNQKVN